jgi:hypothetical protein
LKVGDLTVPLPVFRDPFATDVGAVTGENNIVVEIITPQACGRTGRAHVDGESVNLYVLETVTGQKVVTGSGRTVFQNTLDTHVHPERSRAKCSQYRQVADLRALQVERKIFARRSVALRWEGACSSNIPSLIVNLPILYIIYMPILL